jgi:hypothetical protein
VRGWPLRLAFLAVLAGGLYLFARDRSPQDMVVEVDLSGALPGDVAETDVIVFRDGRALARVDDRYGARGAPDMLRIPVRARPGPATVEVTLVAMGGAARKTTAAIDLTPARPARLQAR